jgi:DNA-binding CsgD family transcriptional regulator
MKEGLDKRTLYRLYIKEQKSTPVIARMYECTHRTVIMRCREHGIKLRPRGKKIEGLNKSVLQRLHMRDDKSVGEIAERFSCHPETVRRKCKQYDIAVKSSRKIKGLSKALLEQLYINEGKTTREIGRILGCSYDVVRKRCREYGIPLRPTGSKRVDIDKSTLSRLHIQEGKTFTEIAKIFNCVVCTVSCKAKKYGIKNIPMRRK